MVGTAVGLALAVAFLAVGLVGKSRILFQIGGGLLVLVVTLVAFGLRDERRERGKLALVPMPPDPASVAAPQQVVGRECATCARRVTFEKDARWCTDCHIAHHHKCEHYCTPPTSGPDWPRMQRA